MVLTSPLEILSARDLRRYEPSFSSLPRPLELLLCCRLHQFEPSCGDLSQSFLHPFLYPQCISPLHLIVAIRHMHLSSFSFEHYHFPPSGAIYVPSQLGAVLSFFYISHLLASHPDILGRTPLLSTLKILIIHLRYISSSLILVSKGIISPSRWSWHFNAIGRV